MPTIKDVAKMANVSITTVSRVINNKGYISETTRKNVYDAMKALDYAPHQVARALSMKQSFLIGLILPDASHPFFAEMVQVVEEVAQTKGYKVLVCNSLNNSKKEQEYISMLKENRVDGIIIGSHTLELSAYEAINRPLVTFERHIKDVPCITSDNFGGGQMATQHLIDQGCKKLLHICGPLNKDITSNLRSDAFKITCINNSVDHDMVIYESDQLDFSCYEDFIKDEIGPILHSYDGVFCNNDYLAYALYVYCTRHDIDVPDQLRIVGYDHSRFTQVLRTPVLTTIAQPIELISKILCDSLIQKIEGKDVHSQQLPVSLVLGET